MKPQRIWHNIGQSGAEGCHRWARNDTNSLEGRRSVFNTKNPLFYRQIWHILLDWVANKNIFLINSLWEEQKSSSFLQKSSSFLQKSRKTPPAGCFVIIVSMTPQKVSQVCCEKTKPVCSLSDSLSDQAVASTEGIQESSHSVNIGNRDMSLGENQHLWSKVRTGIMNVSQ